MAPSDSERSTRTTADARAARLPGVLQFMQLLWAVVHGIETRSKRMTSELGVTGPQRLVLRVAGLFPGLSAGDLAAILHVHPSTLTGVLKRLIAQGMLARRDDPNDRRRAVLRLTARGARINATSAGTVEGAIERALAGVSKRDIGTTRRTLDVVVMHLRDGGRSRGRHQGQSRKARKS